MASNSILAKMAVLISTNQAEFGKAMKENSSAIKRLETGLTGFAATAGVAFGTKEILEFGFEISKLAGEADGVGKAFNKLPNSTKLIEQLKLATSETVSELELMKRTVQASNFGISLEALPKLLEFASVRAQQTGQSVDYLVDSIVTGIGRKSPLILDNLGISATALKQKLGGVSLEAAGVGKVAEAVGKIATEELAKMGGMADNTATDIQQLNAAWENFKVSLGSGLNSTGIFSGALNQLTDLIKDFSGENKLVNAVGSLGTAFNAGQNDATGFLGTVKELEKELGKGNLVITAKDLQEITKNMKNAATVTEQLKERLGELGIQIIGLNEIPLGPDLLTRWVPNIPPAVTTLSTLQAKIKELNDQFENTDANDTKKLSNIGSEILAVKKQVEALEELRKKRELLNTQPVTAFGKEQEAFATKKAADPTRAGDSTDKLAFKDLSAGTPNTAPLSIIPDITEQVTAYVENVGRAKTSLAEWGVQMGLTADQQQVQFERQIQTAVNYGQAVGDAISTSINEQESGAKSLKRVTNSIVQQFLRQAQAAIIASATKTSGPPPLVIAMAVAGLAAISALFSKIGGSGGGGGGGGGGLARSAVSSTSRNISNPDGQRIDLNATFVISGDNLVAVVDKTNSKNGRLNG